MKIEVFKSKFRYDNMRTSGGKPTEEMSAYLKANGYRWSRTQNCWYPATTAAREANSGFFEKFEKQFAEAFEQSGAKLETPKTDIIEDLVNVATEGKFNKNEVKEKADAIKEQVIVEHEKSIKLEELIRDAKLKIDEQQKEIERLTAELAALNDGSLEEYETYKEQKEADEEAEWERENSLTDDDLKRMAEGNKGAGDDSDKETVAVEPVMVTAEELETFKAFAPAAQYAFTLELADGEEGDFFKQKIKDFAKAIDSAPKIGMTDGAESHPVILRYFHPTGAEALVCEIGKDGEAFGWQCINGDYEMAEWGYLNLDEIRGIDRMELDYHVPEGTTIERWIEDHSPKKVQEKKAYDVAQETGNNVEAIAEAMKTKNEKFQCYYNSYMHEYIAIRYKDNDWEYASLDDEHNIIYHDIGFSPKEEKTLDEALNSVIELYYRPDDQSSVDYDMTQEKYSELVERAKWLDIENWTKINFEIAEKISEALEQIQRSPSEIQETPFDRVTKRYSEKYKDFYETYNAKKEEFLENESRYVGNARIRHAFEDIHEELVKLQVEEVNDIIKESSTIEEAKENAIRYFNFNGNDGLVTGCLYFATGIGFYDKGTFRVSNEKMNEYIESKFIESHNMVQVDLDEIKDAMVEAHGGKDKPTLEDIVTDKFAEKGITDDSGHVVQSTLMPKQIQKIREQCREILEKLDNSYFNEKEREYLKENYEQSEQDQKQVEASLRSIRYYYVTKKDKDGYWEPEKKGKEITANEARKMLSMSDFVSAIDRASFHWTSGREVQGGKGYIHFNDSDRDRVVPPYELTKEDLAILAQYEGAGGLKEENRSNAGILNEFYTPNNLVDKVWQIVDHYAPNAVTVLEPSAGVGKFANNRPDNKFTMHELDETSARINKILHPDANIIQGAYQKQFFDESERFHVGSGYKQPKYDIVIGNPPYGEYKDKWKGLGEGKEFDRYEEYFIAKGLDALKDENSLLAFVVPSGFLNTDDDKQKEILATNGKLVDAYRLPEGTFPTTEVGTDIVVFKKWESPKEFNENYLENKNLLSNAEWFKQHPEKILGEVKTRKNRFGREEEYVAVHEGLSIQDELDKIDGLLPQLEKSQENENEQKQTSNEPKPKTVEEINAEAEKYGYSFEYEQHENVVDIYKDEEWIGTLDENGDFGFTDDWEEQMPNEVGQLAAQYFELVTIQKTETMTGEIVEYNEILSWNALVKEVDKAIKAGTYLNESEQEKLEALQKEIPAAEEPAQEKTIKTIEPAQQRRMTVKKLRGEVMSAEEFSRLYGRDFDKREFPIWRATDWEGKIDLSKLSPNDREWLENSGKYVEAEAGEWTHKVLFTTGDIYEKVSKQKALLESAKEEGNVQKITLHKKNIEILESSKKPLLDLPRIHFGLQATLAEEFKIPHVNSNNDIEELNLQESFILWAQNANFADALRRGEIDFATANISREEFPENVEWRDIVDFIDGRVVKSERTTWWETRNMDELEKKAFKAEKKREADEKRQARADTANKLFDRYIHEGLDEKTRERLVYEYNRRFNSYIIPDYSKLPLFVDGMSAYKGPSAFKLYDQQIKGISFLCNKGNGLLAYDVGVGKTAAGIVATVNQIQTARSSRPLIVVPNQVYSKWYSDIRELFPKIKVNDLYNLNSKSVKGYVDKDNPHKLNIPENSITLCTYEALKNITFTDESCAGQLYDDFANLLSADFDGSDRENAGSSEKIMQTIGAASKVDNAAYYFYEDCGFDHLTVDEAHNFKNLWTVPRPKNKGESNEYKGIPAGKPSARALKMYAMTQLTQANNDNRNVFMLTATPFTNSPLEVYSMLSYVGRERLEQSGVRSLRDFLNQFAQTKQELGVTSSGEVDTKQVMKSWKELPALQSMLTEFIDKVDGEEAGIIRPYKFTHVKPLDMSPLQKKMREIDEARMAEIKEGNSAAIIVAMNNMRLSCVAPALANPAMYEGLELPPLSQLVETSPKLKFVCDAIIDMYKGNPEKSQFMYVPLGKDSHGIIKDYLVAHGIPKNAVEIVNGEVNNTPEKKEAVTAKFNDAKNPLKIIIGGRNTCEGIDLNGNSFVMYNCSLGWNPSETIQAEGRIWRQGNLQGHVHVVYPVMNDSIDSVLYQKHDEKRSRINELWNYKGDALNVEDINPEDLKLDLIKDPQKKAKLILMEETKESRAELSRIKLKMQTFDDLIERRKELNTKFEDSDRMVKGYEEQIESYKKTGLEIPEWIKVSLKDNRNDKIHAESGLSTIQSKLEALGIKSDEDTIAYIKNVNAEKRMAEDKIEKAELELPKIIKRLQIEQAERKLTEYPVEKQREILEADILNNLRPMKEVEREVKTVRFEKMLDEKLKAGEISKEDFDIYKSAGYERYEKWLNGEIDSLDGAEAAQEQETEVQKPANADVAEKKNESVKITTESGLPTRQQLEEWKKPIQNDALKELENDKGSLFYMPATDGNATIFEPEQPYFNAGNDDYSLTPEQLTQSEMRRDELVLPILNGKESGMYKAFKDFAERGVFDIVGQKVDLQDYGAISKTGWEQLHAAMNIYRDKRFETMRFVLVNRASGEIEDQFTSCCHMPNKCGIKNSDDAQKSLISRAEEKDCLIVAVHNHPSGNVMPSIEDMEFTELLKANFTNSAGKSRFGGHIILDHDTYSLYTPEKGWDKKIDLEHEGDKDPLNNESFKLKNFEIVGGLSLSNVAKKVNDINNWNDNFVPVVFTTGSIVTGMKLYDKSFFDQDAQKIRNEFQFAGLEAGANRAYPVYTEALAQKLGTVMGIAFEERLAELVRLNAFTDAALPDEIMWRHDIKAGIHTVTEVYGTKPGLDYFKISAEELNNLSRIQTTWETKINPELFKEEQEVRNPFPTAKQERPRQKSGAMGY